MLGAGNRRALRNRPNAVKGAFRKRKSNVVQALRLARLRASHGAGKLLGDFASVAESTHPPALQCRVDDFAGLPITTAGPRPRVR
jgi:hypothetical protein